MGEKAEIGRKGEKEKDHIEQQNWGSALKFFIFIFLALVAHMYLSLK